jgi:hypothetical protein
MANVYLLNLSDNQVTLGNVFDSSKSYIVKDTLDYQSRTFAFTKVVSSPSLRVYREPIRGILLNAYADRETREQVPSDGPVSGPFIENYSYTGELKTDTFVNLLLIDKPPVRTGFFKFSIGTVSFTGIVRQRIPYVHYDWERNGSKYEYIRKPDDLGYAIEISKNLLYTAVTNTNGTTYTPTNLNFFLKNLNGREEITSFATTDNPNSYLQSIPGANAKISGALPESIFYISPEYALRYIASYPDLITSYGTNYALGQSHYARYGAFEGRIISFDPIVYLNKYQDLRQTYGYDTYRATIHYITTGYYEGRTLDLSSGFNPLTGGLYDERNYSISLTNKNIIWPVGKTSTAKGKQFTYKYGTTSYYLGAALDFESNVIYLKVQ